MDEKQQFAERLRTAMAAAGYEARPSVLEREFNLVYGGRPVTYQAVRRWLTGMSIPEQDKLQTLAEWLGVEPHVLRFGRKANRVGETARAWPSASTPQDRAAMEAYLQLPAGSRKVVREVIAALLAAQKAS
ncbi:MAG: hypothetical protein QM761_11660 [Pseudoxanthomonas sp.]